MHVHDVAFDPYENNDTFDSYGTPTGIIWICTGDGGGNAMYFYLRDRGVTWNKSTPKNRCSTQATVVGLL